MTGPCTERTALVLNYSDATKRYSVAVDKIHQRIANTSRSEYERLYRIAEEARVSAETARLAIETHVTEHGC